MAPTILDLHSIKKYLQTVDLIPLLEDGFIAYSSNQVVVPPVGELLFDNPPGEAHIKYGYIKNNPFYVVKIASGFYENKKLGIPSSQGLMLLFSQQTGELVSILLDEGHLTNVRTAIASMITLKHLAPKKLDSIGIIGTGIQAHLQLSFLHKVSDCKNILIWGRDESSCLAYQKYFQDGPYHITIADSIPSLAQSCSVIITTTASTSPLISVDDVRPGTHITALGSDTAEKAELSPSIIAQADLVISDSINQSRSRGEVYQARKSGHLDENKLTELGTLIMNPKQGRINDNQITVADLTGVAVQDIMIATAIYNHHKNLTK